MGMGRNERARRGREGARGRDSGKGGAANWRDDGSRGVEGVAGSSGTRVPLARKTSSSSSPDRACCLKRGALDRRRGTHELRRREAVYVTSECGAVAALPISPRRCVKLIAAHLRPLRRALLIAEPVRLRRGRSRRRRHVSAASSAFPWRSR
ncbi:hypothetical protein MTO96_030527 [Rhipicephalus appendiculatus]